MNAHTYITEEGAPGRQNDKSKLNSDITSCSNAFSQNTSTSLLKCINSSTHIFQDRAGAECEVEGKLLILL